jgi:precorrin-2 dehydrogenase/sirohydrochlorin ferrochelatase
MADFPLLFRLQGRLCVVVGGGPVGWRKVRALREAQATVRLVDPSPADNGRTGGIEMLYRPFRPEDLDGAALAFAATGDREINAAVAREARRRSIPVNIADAPEEGDFALPAVGRRGEITLAVGTGGASPALASLLRDRISAALGPEWETVLALASALRRKGLTPSQQPAYNFEVLRCLLADGLPEMIAGDDLEGVDRLLAAHLGEGFSLAELGIHMPEGKR